MVITPQLPKVRGGDTVQMQRTAKALWQMDIDVSISVEPQPVGSGFDIAHVFNLRTIEATTRQVESLARFGIPIVMSPIFPFTSIANLRIVARKGACAFR